MKNIKDIKGKLGTTLGILFVMFVLWFLVACMITVKQTKTHIIDVEYTMESGDKNREIFFLVYHPSNLPKQIVLLKSDTLQIGNKYKILSVKDFRIMKHKIED